MQADNLIQQVSLPDKLPSTFMHQYDSATAL